jgi:hypothetical protein
MTRVYLWTIAAVVALLAAAAVGCGDLPTDVPEPVPTAGTEALHIVDDIGVDLDWHIDLTTPRAVDHMTLDEVTNPRGEALEYRTYDRFDVSDVEFVEGGWGFHMHCGLALTKAVAAADTKATDTCRETEHTLAWAENLGIDTGTASVSDYGCMVKVAYWYVCH